MSGAYAIAVPYRGGQARGFQDAIGRAASAAGDWLGPTRASALGARIGYPGELNTVVRRYGVGVGMRVLGRFVPVLNIALLAYDAYQIYQWWKATPVGVNYLPGFTMTLNCNRSADTTPRSFSHGACFSTSAVAGCGNQHPAANPLAVAFGIHHNNTCTFGNQNWTPSSNWTRDAGSTKVVPLVKPWPAQPARGTTEPVVWGTPKAFPFPAIAPWAIPIGSFETGRALPYKLLPAMRPSRDVPQSVQRMARYGANAGRARRKVPPYVIPGTTQPVFPPIVGTKGVAPAVSHGHVLAKAPPREVQNKMRLSLNGSPVGIVVNAASEVGDLVDAIYFALEPERTVRVDKGRGTLTRPDPDRQFSFRKQTGPVKLWDPVRLQQTAYRLGRIWQRRAELPRVIGPAIDNLLWNEVGDRVYGIAGRVDAALGRAAGFSPAVLRRQGGVSTRAPKLQRPGWWITGTRALGLTQ